MGRKSMLAILSLLILLPVYGQTKKTYQIKKIGKSPNFIALSPDGGRMYATSFGTNELIGIDLSKREVDQRIRVGNAPLGFALAEEGK